MEHINRYVMLVKHLVVYLCSEDIIIHPIDSSSDQFYSFILDDYKVCKG